MNEAYLALGSNLGDRDAMLRDALVSIEALPGTEVVVASPIYETPPMGPQDQGAYLNMAAKLTTAIDALALLRALQAIEVSMGRAPMQERRRWGPREIDIDLLMYGDEVIDEPGLIVPHPGMHLRWFVLKPLSDIAPELTHPLLGRSIGLLLQAVDAPASYEAMP